MGKIVGKVRKKIIGLDRILTLIFIYKMVTFVCLKTEWPFPSM